MHECEKIMTKSVFHGIGSWESKTSNDLEFNDSVTLSVHLSLFRDFLGILETSGNNSDDTFPQKQYAATVDEYERHAAFSDLACIRVGCNERVQCDERA